MCVCSQRWCFSLEVLFNIKVIGKGSGNLGSGRVIRSKGAENSREEDVIMVDERLTL